MKVYPADTSRCTLCDDRIQSTRHAALFIVDTGSAIGYALCGTCGPNARRGLSDEQLRLIEVKLDAVAASYGIKTR